MRVRELRKSHVYPARRARATTGRWTRTFVEVRGLFLSQRRYVPRARPSPYPRSLLRRVIRANRRSINNREKERGREWEEARERWAGAREKARESERYAPPVRFRYDTNTIRARKDGRPCDLICQVTRTIHAPCVPRYASLAKGRGRKRERESERATPRYLGRPAAKFQVNILRRGWGVRDTRGSNRRVVPICTRGRGSRSRFVDSASLRAALPLVLALVDGRTGGADGTVGIRPREYRVYKRSLLGESRFNAPNCLFVTRPRPPPSLTKTIHSAPRANKAVPTVIFDGQWCIGWTLITEELQVISRRIVQYTGYENEDPKRRAWKRDLLRTGDGHHLLCGQQQRYGGRGASDRRRWLLGVSLDGERGGVWQAGMLSVDMKLITIMPCSTCDISVGSRYSSNWKRKNWWRSV